MKINYLGHSCFLFEVDGIKILTDPFLDSNPNGKIKAKNVSCDIMLITHGHGDHISEAEEIAKASQCKVLTNFEIGNWLAAKGVENCVGMNHGGSVGFEHGTIKMVNAAHSSSFPDGGYAGNPAGFIIKTKDLNVYFAGDTGLMADMKVFGEHENIGLSILPIGDVFTMGVDDAIIAAEMLQCQKVIGMHYDTFPPIVIDKEKAKKKFKDKGYELDLLEIGINTEY